MDGSAHQLSGGAAEVLSKRLGGSVFGVPPPGQIELLSPHQSQKIGAEPPDQAMDGRSGW